MEDKLTPHDFLILDNMFLREVEELRRLSSTAEADKRLTLRNKVLDLLSPHVVRPEFHKERQQG